jgi:hypothetical protein
MTASASNLDFRVFYELEPYLFNTVSQRFAEQRVLNAVDFFCIVIWKANRSKSKVARRLMVSGRYATLDGAVGALTSAIAAAAKPEDRFRVLMKEWGFRLPMASAIATVLYPSDFTVYDVRVCDMLGDFQRLSHIINYDRLWDEYAKYLAAVERAAPRGLSLGEKDRWIWGKSFHDELLQDIAVGFAHAKPEREIDAIES